jgi:uncharacterized protein (TIGR03435 family)
MSKSGIKMTQSKESSCVSLDLSKPQDRTAPGEKPTNICGTWPGSSGAVLNGLGVTMTDLPGPPFQSLTGQLSLRLGRTVVDKTGLIGNYDVHLEWTPNEFTAGAPGTSGSDGGAVPGSSDEGTGSIFTAVKQQLGLELRSAKGAVSVLVIDHVEESSPN